jgi:hypothetical protein
VTHVTPRTEWVTAAACNYLPQVRVLARSFTRHHPGRQLTVLFTDTPPAGVDLAREPYTALFPDDVGIPREWAMTHTCKELSAAAKPHLMLHALRSGADAVIFIDPDTIVLGAMNDVEQHVAAHSLTLRPHLLEAGRRDDALRAFVEDRVLEAGVFNGGLIGAADTDEAGAFLTWWADALGYGCRHDLARAQHFDQRWLDLAPSFVADLARFADPGLNVAFWSLPGARIADDRDGSITVNGHPVRLLHFTGFVPERDDVLVAYFDEFLRVDDVPALAPLYGSYAQQLASEGRTAWRVAPYGFGHFDDGSPVPDVARRAYAEMGSARAEFGGPFRSGQGSFQAWLAAPADEGSPAISCEWMEAWARHEHLREAFPDPLGCNREAFHAWTMSQDAQESRVATYVIHS